MAFYAFRVCGFAWLCFDNACCVLIPPFGGGFGTLEFLFSGWFFQWVDDFAC